MKPFDDANESAKESQCVSINNHLETIADNSDDGQNIEKKGNQTGSKKKVTIGNSSSDEVNKIGKPGLNSDNEGKRESKKTSSEPETRGRKVTSINFLPCDCKLCGEKFDSDKALGYHIRDVHVVGKKDKKEEDGNRKKKPKDYHYIRGKDWKVLNPKRPYCCSTCGKRFLYESSLNHHKVVKHDEKVTGGSDDGVNNASGAASGSGNIPPKMYNHTFQCDQCGKILMSKHSLIRHLVSFHGTDHEKPFQCDICGQRYVSISSLVSHRRKEHTGDKPYVCEHCGKAFTMSNRLKCHLRVHSDEKFYKCQQCSKQFKSCSAFRAHKDTHLGVMRHTCKFCGRKFLFQGNMIKHIRRRHPDGDKLTETLGTAEGVSMRSIASDSIQNSNNTMTNSSIESGDVNNNLTGGIMKSDNGTNVDNLTVNNNNIHEQSALHSSTVTASSTTICNSIAPVTLNNNNSSRRPSHRYNKTIQTPDHSYFSKEATIQANQHSHLDIIEHQQQNLSLSPLEHFVQPEIQFQVLPLSSLPNQDLVFNGITTYPPSNLNQNCTTGTSNTMASSSLTSSLNQPANSRDMRPDLSTITSGKCRLCDQAFIDIRFHISDFHRIPLQKVESMIPTMIYF